MANLHALNQDYLEYLLFIVYLIFFAWLVTRIKFFNQSGLSRSQLIIIFLLKVMAGIFYGWIGLYYGGLAQMSDTWGYHTAGVGEYNLLLTDPHEYLTNLFYNPYDGGFQKFFNADNSYWNDLKGNAFIKFLSIFDILSFGHYYVNVVFYSFVTLFGPIALYRVMKDAFPSQKMPVLLATFLVPTFLYWTSGVHKEGIIFLGISLVIYHVYFGWKEKRYGLKRIVGILLGLFLLLVFRNFLLVIMLPAVFVWMLANRWPKHGLAIFASCYLLFSILFFTARYIHPSLDFPLAVVEKQKAFMQIQGISSIPIRELEPTLVSFLQSIPEAFTLSIIRPYPGDVKHILSLAAAVEVNLLFLLIIAFILVRKPSAAPRNFIYFCLFFSLSVLLAIGFSVNNLGAIVRYRSVVISLLVIPMVAQIDWTRINNRLFNGMKNK